MGLAKGIFTVDSHVFAQTMRGKDYSSMLLYHMDKYDVDFCVIKNVGGMSNKVNAEIIKRNPEKFVALCHDEETQRKQREEGAKWCIEDSIKELDQLLSTGLYSGIGESIPRDRAPRKKLISWDERLDQICQVMELARKYKCPILYITGWPLGSASTNDMGRNRAHAESCDNGNPLLCHEIAAMYPDVPIIMCHGGIEASAYYLDDYEKCLNVAASHHNVFLECGQWWAELYDKPLQDPNIGAKKLVWGTGWGQTNLTQQRMPGRIPETFTVMNIEEGRAKHTPDIWGWSLREIGRLNIPQDDLNLILGGNAAHLFKIKTPQPYERLFKRVERKYIK